MKSAPDNRKLSLNECKKILNTDGVFYTDEEVVELRDWLYHMADIVFDTMDREETERHMESINKET
ncbi:MAG: hypothetical protein NT150_09410 [Bacteroidetes bacterium]|nr:hypothetical protein [Bacteroidota bacterium]